MSKLSSESAPLIREDFLDKIDSTFKQLTPVPNVTTIEELMFNAGQRELIQWIKAQVK